LSRVAPAFSTLIASVFVGFCFGCGTLFTFPTDDIIGITAHRIGCVLIGPVVGFFLGMTDNSFLLDLFKRRAKAKEKPAGVNRRGPEDAARTRARALVARYRLSRLAWAANRCRESRPSPLHQYKVEHHDNSENFVAEVGSQDSYDSRKQQNNNRGDNKDGNFHVEPIRRQLGVGAPCAGCCGGPGKPAVPAQILTIAE
jgi:hypothetical protein